MFCSMEWKRKTQNNVIIILIIIIIIIIIINAIVIICYIFVASYATSQDCCSVSNAVAFTPDTETGKFISLRFISQLR
jgi:flagellar basal body-associated protein FliL